MQIPRASALPTGIDEQVPSAVDSAQVRQAPVQELEQQTPSTQCPLPHSVAAMQGWPSAFGPQLPATQLWLPTH